jgi:hypothetical protein
MRFCVKPLACGRSDCGIAAHARLKYDMEPSSYYVKMKGDTALCYPFVTQAALVDTDSLNMVTGQHSSMEWAAVLLDFLRLHGLLKSTGLTEDEESVGGSGDELSLKDHGLDVLPETAVGSSFFFGDGDSATKALLASPRGRLKRGDISPSPSLLSFKSLDPVASVLSSLSFSRDAWNALRPEVVESTLEGGEDNTLFKPMLVLQQNVKTLSTSVEGILDKLPVALDHLDSKAEAVFATKTSVQQAVAPVGDLKGRMTVLSSLVQGSMALTDVEEFSRHYGCVLGCFYRLKETINDLAETVDSTPHHADPQGLDQRFLDFATKAANAVRAASDHAMAERLGLMQRIEALEQHQGQPKGSGASVDDIFANVITGVKPSKVPPVSVTAPASPLATDGLLGHIDGEAISLLWLVQHLRDQEGLIQDQRKEINSLKSSTYAKGVKVGFIIFEQVEDILRLIENEDIDPAHLAAAVDVNSLLVHYPDGNSDTEKSTSELKNARAAGITDTVCCGYIAAFRQKHPPFLLGDAGKSVPEGTRFPLLKNRTAWEGKPSVEGGRKSLLKAVKDALGNCKQYIADFIPAGQFKDLMLLLANRSSEWWIALVAYIEDELIALGQFGIPEDKVYTLVCDELQIMFRKMFERRMKMQVFSSTLDSKIYLAKAVWVTMQCHMVMDEFEELGFGTHVLISSLFTRFLAEQTGSNFASGLAKKLTDLKGEMDKLKAEIEKNRTYLDGRIAGVAGRADKALAACTKGGKDIP